MFGSIEVNASSGRLSKNSIKTCNGTTYGQHSSDNHWHVAEEKDGNYYATGSPIYSNPCSSSNSSSNNNPNGSSNQNNNSSNSSSNNTTTKNETTTSKEEKPKSKDNTLKVIIIDNKEFEVTDDIEYSTTNEKVNIEVETNDDKATYEIKNNSTLLIGDNKITIEVKAEDGTEQNYEINIYKYSKTENVIYTILGFVFLGSIGYGIYYVIKKIK